VDSRWHRPHFPDRVVTSLRADRIWISDLTTSYQNVNCVMLAMGRRPDYISAAAKTSRFHRGKSTAKKKDHDRSFLAFHAMSFDLQPPFG
jgi:hypothetical protein